MGVLVIGDVHGKINGYLEILRRHENCSESIQVGDFGFKVQHEWHLKNIDFKKHKINFGNHDDQTFVYERHSLGDYSFSKTGIMTVRGAYSIDQERRTEGVDWWRNEELSYQILQDAFDFYHHKKPKIMITHDCPQSIREKLFGIQEKCITTNALEAMFDLHKPELWIFGHHHKSIDTIINGTRFICLAELETFLIQ